MARITVEDCVTKVSNRFELCLIASNRAKSILSGAHTSFDRKEKPAVIALREIAEDLIDVEAQKQNIIRSIKNRGIVEVVSGDSEINEIISEETEENPEEKNSSFINENVEIED